MKEVCKNCKHSDDDTSPTEPAKSKTLIELLPSPREAAREEIGPTDSVIATRWLYAENGKAPR